MRILTTIALTVLMALGPVQAEEVLRFGTIEIVAPFSRATLPRAPTGGAYFTIVNTGIGDDRLVSATSPKSGDVQMHEMKIENNVASMRELTDGIVIPAGGSVALEPSGTHLMLNHLTQPLIEGQQLPLTLTFEHAGTVNFDLPIGSIAAREPPK